MGGSPCRLHSLVVIHSVRPSVSQSVSSSTHSFVRWYTDSNVGAFGSLYVLAWLSVFRSFSLSFFLSFFAILFDCFCWVSLSASLSRLTFWIIFPLHTLLSLSCFYCYLVLCPPFSHFTGACWIVHGRRVLQRIMKSSVHIQAGSVFKDFFPPFIFTWRLFPRLRGFWENVWPVIPRLRGFFFFFFLKWRLARAL